MDPFVPVALTFGMLVAASQQAMLMEQYAARARYATPVAVQPVWVPADAGAVQCPCPPSPAVVAARTQGSSEFIAHWQDFMQPSVSRGGGFGTPGNWNRGR